MSVLCRSRLSVAQIPDEAPNQTSQPILQYLSYDPGKSGPGFQAHRVACNCPSVPPCDTKTQTDLAVNYLSYDSGGSSPRLHLILSLAPTPFLIRLNPSSLQPM